MLSHKSDKGVIQGSSYSPVSQQHSGAAVVLRWSAYIHPRLVYAGFSLPGRLYSIIWRLIVISQQLSGAAMVRRWSAYIHPRLVWGQVCGSGAVLVAVIGWEVWRTGQAGVLETELEIKDE